MNNFLQKVNILNFFPMKSTVLKLYDMLCDYDWMNTDNLLKNQQDHISSNHIYSIFEVIV